MSGVIGRLIWSSGKSGLESTWDDLDASHAMTRLLAPRLSLFAVLAGIACVGLLVSAIAEPGASPSNFGFLTGSTLVLLLGAIAAYKKRRALALVLGCGLIAAFLAKMSVVTIGDGWPTRNVRLTLVNLDGAGGQEACVYWLDSGPRGTVEVAWDGPNVDRRSCEFVSPTTLIVTERTWAFGSRTSWGYFFDRPVLIRLGDGSELAFPLSELVSAPHSGAPPAELQAIVDVKECLGDPARRTDVPSVLRAMELPPRADVEQPPGE
jgi:hypothetical protein